MPKIEDILKAQGYTEADIQAVAPLLGDARFRGALEGAVDLMAKDLHSYKTENDKWAEYDEQHVKPTLALYEKEKADAVAASASLEARLKLAEEKGFAPLREQPANNQPPPGDGAFDPKKHKLITEDDLKRTVSEYADAEGRAIAMAQDLGAEYQHLFGKSLFDYTYQMGDGRVLRGMTALRTEAQQARKPVYDYVSEKFKFAERRSELDTASKKAAEDAIRKDERSKVMAETMNPNTRQLLPSREPFIPAPRKGNEGKMPWDIPAQERSRARIDRALSEQFNGGVN